MSSDESAWALFVAQLAEAPVVAHRLLTIHLPDKYSRCVACTTPGRGTPMAPWPCSIHMVATEALLLRTTSTA